MQEESGLTPGELFAIINRRKMALIVPFVLFVAVASLIALLLPSVYRSTSTILIEQREIPAEYVTSSITTFAEQRIQSINQRILTSSRLLELIQQFDLYTHLKDKKTTDEIIEKMREDITLQPVTAEIADRRSGKTAIATIAFSLSYEGKSPSKVQKVTNTITSLFLKEDIKVRKEQASSAYDFLVSERDNVQAQINGVEKKMAVFKKKNVDSLPELFQLNRQSLDNIDRSLEHEKELLRSYKEKKEALEAELVNTAVFLEDTELQAGQKHQDERRLELLKMELIELKTKFSDLYPDVKKVKEEIKELTVKVEESRRGEDEKQKNPAYIMLSSRFASVKSDISSKQNQIRDLEAQADQYRNRLAATPGVEEKYNAMVAERNNLYAKLGDLQSKMMEAKVAREFESKQKGERFSLIESARLPEKPFKPNRFAIILIGIVLGMGAGVGVASVLEFSDLSFRSAEPLSKGLGFPVLAEVPFILTKDDEKRKKDRMIWMIAGTILLIIISIVLFDQFVMDLDVFQAKLERKML